MIAQLRDPRRLGLLVLVVVLAGATAFGLVHIVVGGLIHGNARAGGFGVVLAIAAGSLLAGVVALGRRVGR